MSSKIFIASDVELEEIYHDYDNYNDDYFSLEVAEDVSWYCDKEFGVDINLCCNEKNMIKIIDYIKDILNRTDCVEIWNIWLDNSEMTKTRTKTVDISILNTQHIKYILECEPWDNQDIINAIGLDIPIYYCLRIVR